MNRYVLQRIFIPLLHKLQYSLEHQAVRPHHPRRVKALLGDSQGIGLQTEKISTAQRGLIALVACADPKAVFRHRSVSRTRPTHPRSNIVSSVSASKKGFRMALDEI